MNWKYEYADQYWLKYAYNIRFYIKKLLVVTDSKEKRNHFDWNIPAMILFTEYNWFN